MSEILIGECENCGVCATTIGTNVRIRAGRTEYLYVCVDCARAYRAKPQKRKPFRVVNPDRWENAKLTGLWISVLGMLAGAGGLEGEPERAIPYPALLMFSALAAIAFASQLKPRK